MAITRIYLRASSSSQDELRAKESVEAFAASMGLLDTVLYAENESGAKFSRPILFKLLEDSKPNDVLLIESIDRLSRLVPSDWDKLKILLNSKGLRLIVQDLPTSHQTANDNLTGGIIAAINNMMIDIMALMARRDYEKRSERMAQGIAKAKLEGKYTGKQANIEKNAQATKLLLGKQHTWSEIQELTGLSRGQLSKLNKASKAL